MDYLCADKLGRGLPIGSQFFGTSQFLGSHP